MYANTLLQKSPGGMEKALAMTRPMRSMSLRERHDMDMRSVLIHLFLHLSVEVPTRAYVQ